MPEKDFRPTAASTAPMKRHSVATNPAPMKRKERPAKFESSFLLDKITPESALTDEQKQPLSARENPAPSEAVFPKPVPAEKTAPVTYTQIKATTRTAAVKPMKRHIPTKSEVKAMSMQLKYTQQESIASSPEERGDGNAKAAVVKIPVDKKPFILSAVAVFLALVIILGCVFGVRTGGGTNGPSIGGNDDPPTVSWNDPPAIDRNQQIEWNTPFSATATDSVLSPVDPDDPEVQNSYSYDFASNSVVGYSADVVRTLDSSEIVKPVESPKDENLTQTMGLSAYPTYGRTPSGVLGTGDAQVALRNALIAESAYVASSNTSHNSGASPRPYNMMDSEGKLWYANGGTVSPSLEADGVTQRTLYAHTSSVGLYGGNVSDTEPRIVKKVTIRPRGYSGYSVTGLYAPAGEVIKIEIDDKDMNATGGLTIHIGQALYNGQANNIWTAKNQMQRFPVILNTMLVNKSTATLDEETGIWTAYVGSFLGGPLYIRNTNAKFTATISGCVTYSHFILGHTTEAEFNENAKSTAPYFDLEVWDRGVLHSGPKRYAAGRSYQDIYKAAVLWEKVATVTTTGSFQGIVFMYEAFVAAGAAVAFPGRRSVNCPEGWMASSLNYNGLVTSGAWGNFHEYHHNFQGYGVGNGGEVTNNGMTLVSYALFTKISANRGISNYGAGSLGGWNAYTSATWALNEVLKISKGGEPSNGKQGLTLYSTLLHNFGADNYIQAKVRQQSKGYGQSYSGYMRAWQDITHNNMSYFFKDILCGLDQATADKWANTDYPMFVPVSCVYQTGRSYMYDGQKNYFQTMRPYVIPYGQPFEIDLTRYSAPEGQYAGGSIVMPEGFQYRIKSVSSPKNGKIELKDNYHLLYTPDPNNTSSSSGQIVVTLEIVKDDKAFEVKDIDLVLEFELSHETNKMTLERTTYTFDDAHMYSDVEAAYGANFAGYASKVESNHSNPTQNCNTDVWLVPDTDAGHASFPNAKEQEFAKPNQIIELKGKLYFAEAGTYRIYLRGRVNCAAYFSLDGGKTYLSEPKNVAKIKNGTGSGFYTTNPDTYVDLTVEENSWVYYKSAFITQTATQSTIGYMGLGVSQWTQTMFTISEQYCDADGNAVESLTSDNYDHTELTYADTAGRPVAVEIQKAGAETQYFTIVNNLRQPSTQEEISRFTEPTLNPPVSASYVNAYRSDYEFPSNSGFETDFYYQRTYNYDYVGEQIVVTDGKTTTYVPEQSNYRAWNDDPTYAVEHLFDNNVDTVIHTHNSFYVANNNPAIITADIGEEITASILRLYPSNINNLYRNAFPRDFKIEGSLDGVTYFDMGSWTGKTAPALPQLYSDFALNRTHTFRYYKLTITATSSNSKRVAFSGISLVYAMRLAGNGANHIAPDNPSLVYVGEWNTVNLQSSFGYAYRGTNGSKIKFEMIGTRLAILASSAYGKNYEVYIDGQQCPSVSVKEDSGEFAVDYISQKLGSGKHKVEIRCTGDFCLDSIAIYDES